MTVRLVTALRRIDVAARLQRQATAALSARDMLEIGSMPRLVATAGGSAIACLADAWLALAGGDAAGARACLAEARWYRRQTRTLAVRHEQRREMAHA